MFSEYITKSHKADLEVMKKEEEMTLLKSSMEEWTKMASLGWNKQENNPSKTVLMHLPSFKKKKQYQPVGRRGIKKEHTSHHSMQSVSKAGERTVIEQPQNKHF